ncbi:MAG: hypothetical protein ACC707_19505, partial [Thiohalomonadales bacterium]
MLFQDSNGGKGEAMLPRLMPDGTILVVGNGPNKSTLWKLSAEDQFEGSTSRGIASRLDRIHSVSITNTG